jgi:hypothetical protein
MMKDLPLERDPDPALEDRVVRALVAAGQIRRPRPRALWFGLAAVAAALLAVLWPRPHKVGETYVLLLHVDSLYHQPPPVELRRREAEYGRWADSLAALGKLDLEGKLLGQGSIDGMFIVRATSDSEAARIAATCPHYKYGGTVEVRRFVP